MSKTIDLSDPDANTVVFGPYPKFSGADGSAYTYKVSESHDIENVSKTTKEEEVADWKEGLQENEYTGSVTFTGTFTEKVQITVKKRWNFDRPYPKDTITFTLTRYNPDGSVDTGFGKNGSAVRSVNLAKYEDFVWGSYLYRHKSGEPYIYKVTETFDLPNVSGNGRTYTVSNFNYEKTENIYKGSVAFTSTNNTLVNITVNQKWSFENSVPSGTIRYTLTRYKSDGKTVDSSFGTNGSTYQVLNLKSGKNAVQFGTKENGSYKKYDADGKPYYYVVKQTHSIPNMSGNNAAHTVVTWNHDETGNFDMGSVDFINTDKAPVQIVMNTKWKNEIRPEKGYVKYSLSRFDSKGKQDPTFKPYKVLNMENASNVVSFGDYARYDSYRKPWTYKITETCTISNVTIPKNNTYTIKESDMKHQSSSGVYKASLNFENDSKPLVSITASTKWKNNIKPASGKITLKLTRYKPDGKTVDKEFGTNGSTTRTVDLAKGQSTGKFGDYLRYERSSGKPYVYKLSESYSIPNVKNIDTKTRTLNFKANVKNNTFSASETFTNRSAPTVTLNVYNSWKNSQRPKSGNIRFTITRYKSDGKTIDTKWGRNGTVYKNLDLSKTGNTVSFGPYLRFDNETGKEYIYKVRETHGYDKSILNNHNKVLKFENYSRQASANTYKTSVSIQNTFNPLVEIQVNQTWNADKNPGHGELTFHLTRYKADGSVDTAFGTNGTTKRKISAGSKSAVAFGRYSRYDSNGKPYTYKVKETQNVMGVTQETDKYKTVSFTKTNTSGSLHSGKLSFDHAYVSFTIEINTPSFYWGDCGIPGIGSWNSICIAAGRRDLCIWTYLGCGNPSLHNNPWYHAGARLQAEILCTHPNSRDYYNNIKEVGGYQNFVPRAGTIISMGASNPSGYMLYPDLGHLAIVEKALNNKTGPDARMSLFELNFERRQSRTTDAHIVDNSSFYYRMGNEVGITVSTPLSPDYNLAIPNRNWDNMVLSILGNEKSKTIPLYTYQPTYNDIPLINSTITITRN